MKDYINSLTAEQRFILGVMSAFIVALVLVGLWGVALFAILFIAAVILTNYNIYTSQKKSVTRRRRLPDSPPDNGKDE